MRDLAATQLVLCTFAAVLHGTICQARFHSTFGRVRDLDDLGPPANDAIQILTEVTSFTCVRRCVASELCSSVFYDTSKIQCFLLAKRYFSTAGLIPALGLQYWRGECRVAMGFHFDPVSHLCIRVTKQLNVTQETAQTSCTDDNSELINLDSMDKFLALKQFLNTSGLFDRSSWMNFRVSGVRPPNGGLFDFDLDNGRVLPFGIGSPAWNVYQPNNADANGDGKGDQNCLALNIGALLLYDLECAMRDVVIGYICERI